MNVLTRVGVFAATVVAVSAIAAVIGAAVGPIRSPSASDHAAHRAHEDEGSSGRAAAQVEPGIPGGMQITEDGYTLQLFKDTYSRSTPAQLQFRIVDDRGRAITDFETLHGKQLHLIVVRRDLSSYQHVHPVMAVDGTWSANINLDEAGGYSAFVDFQPVGHDRGLTLGHDISVQGPYVPAALPEAEVVTTVDDYEVRLAGELVPGQTSRLTLSVSREGRAVTDLQPYLEAFGHLVALRDGDLAYLHVHPDGAPNDGQNLPGPEITFFAEVPSAGTHRLFLDFKHGDQVRTAAFTAHAERLPSPAADAPADELPVDQTPHGKHPH